MNGGGGDASWPSPPMNGGDFLLQLLQKPPHQPRTTTTTTPPSASAAAIRPSPPAAPPPAQTLTHDPAVAAVGPTLPFPQFPTNGHDFRLPYVAHSPPLVPHNYFLQGLPQNPNPNPNWSSSPAPPGFNQTYHHQNPQFNHQLPQNDVQKLGFFGANTRPNSGNLQEHNLVFGSFTSEIRDNEGPLYGNSHRNLAPGANIEGLRPKDRETGLTNRRLNNLEAEFQNSLGIDRNSPATSSLSRSYRSVAPSPRPPPGFPSKPNSKGASESGNRRSFGHNVDHEKGQLRELNHLGFGSIGVDEREKKFSSERRKARGNNGMGLTDQLDRPGPPVGSNLLSVSASDVEESMLLLHGEIGKDGEKPGSWRQGKVTRGGQSRLESDDQGDQLVDTLVLEDELGNKNDKRKHQNSRDKDYRSDTRGQRTLGQRMRNFKRQIDCRIDIDRLNVPLLAIFESLIPPEEEKAKQKQLLTLLENLVGKEWPEARLYLYGSCASSFGVSKSDIDVCLAIEDAEINKSEVLLKLAEILESDNLQNVQALTRARVPIVKLFDPVTGISCDICINNMLAVVNTKLLRDYAQIDARLRQLAFIVKHWAKSRGVNETYHGTLSSYAYVLMCIHFLQQRKPAILPCLQEMEITYAVTVDNVECAYFDRVEKLSGFGCRNRESIAQLVWAFFNYWAYCHDYASDVISVRTGSTISKRAKDWTRRIGNDRHLICIEDPLETSHDLGRVVDKYSIKVLREEFERAAEILQYDPNPCVTLFEPYVPT